MFKIRDKNGEEVQKDKLKEVKILFLDLDGTLLNSKSKLSQKNLEALVKAKNKGIKIVFATGRSLLSAKEIIGPIVDEIGLNWFPGIYLNGASTFDENGSLIINKTLEESCIIKLFEFACKNSLSGYCVWYTLENSYCSSCYNYTELVALDANDTKPLVAKSDEIKKMPIYKVKLCLNNCYFEQILDLAQIDFADNTLSIKNSLKKYLEFFHPAVSKFEGVKEVCKLYNIDLENALAIGDGENDIEMLEGLPYSVSVSNALEKAKVAAKFIGPSNDEDAVAHVLEFFCDL